MIGNLQVTHFACAQLASIEQEEHFFFGIPVVGDLQNPGNLHLDATLLFAFANQGLLRRLPVFELATWKLPQACQVLSLGATGQEHSAIPDYDGSGNHNRGEGP